MRDRDGERETRYFEEIGQKGKGEGFQSPTTTPRTVGVTNTNPSSEAVVERAERQAGKNVLRTKVPSSANERLFVAFIIVEGDSVINRKMSGKGVWFGRLVPRGPARARGCVYRRRGEGSCRHTCTIGNI